MTGVEDVAGARYRVKLGSLVEDTALPLDQALVRARGHVIALVGHTAGASVILIQDEATGETVRELSTAVRLSGMWVRVSHLVERDPRDPKSRWMPLCSTDKRPTYSPEPEPMGCPHCLKACAPDLFRKS